MLQSSEFSAVVINTPVPGWPADVLLEELQRIKAHVPVLVRDLQASLAEAVRLTKLGAFHFVHHSMSAGEFRALLEAARRAARVNGPAERAARAPEPWRQMLVGQSRAMEETAELVRLLGPRRATVLITGETGTGKELVARALHLASPRAHMPMVNVNCSALPETLLEAELFGHTRGAFTGAMTQRTGRFEQAHKGTLFLDEIAEMPFDLQAKLLRVLQEREFQRVGSSDTVRVDVRVVAACNANLLARVRAGRFREDLYYRLNVVPIETPPLRNRIEDVPLLVRHFVEKIARVEDVALKQVTSESLDRLMGYDWPGNIRQLENTVEMAMILSGERTVLYPGDFRLPVTEQRIHAAGANVPPLIAVPDQGLDFERTVGQIERQILDQALRKTNGNKKQAAEMLGLKRTTLTAKLKSLDALAG